MIRWDPPPEEPYDEVADVLAGSRWSRLKYRRCPEVPMPSSPPASRPYDGLRVRLEMEYSYEWGPLGWWVIDAEPQGGFTRRWGPFSDAFEAADYAFDRGLALQGPPRLRRYGSPPGGWEEVPAGWALE